MDPVSALTGTTAISSNCARCVYTLTKWLSQTKNADTRLHTFKDEVLALQLTYERLSASLQDPIMVKAARQTDEQAGGSLWSQVMTALYDCQTTILLVNQVLDSADKFSRRTSTIIKQVTESLIGGELSKARQTMQLFDTHLTVPLLMINVSLQAADCTIGDTRHRQVMEDLADLKDLVESFRGQVHAVHSIGAGSEARTYKHMKAFVGTVVCYLNVAAAQLAEDENAKLNSPASTQVSQTPQAADIWAELDFSPGNLPTGAEHEPSDSFPPSLPATSSVSDGHTSPHENEIELELTREYIANGQSDLDIGDFNGAEDNFRHALDMATENDLSRELSIGSGGITLMLADCCLRQDKDEDAIELLEPVADGALVAKLSPRAVAISRPDTGLGEQGAALKASYILATIFLKRCDFPNAEKRANQAFKGQRKLLGSQHSMTLDTVQLLIDIYTAKEDKVNARAYRRFLEPPEKTMVKEQKHSMASASPQRSISGLDRVKPENERPATVPAPLQPRQPTSLLAKQSLSRAESPSLSLQPDTGFLPKISGDFGRRPESSLSDAQSTLTPPSAAPSIEPDPLPPNISSSTDRKPTWVKSLSRMGLSSREASGTKKLSVTSLPTSSSRNLSKIDVEHITNRSLSDATSTSHRSRSSISSNPPATRTPQELGPIFKSIRALRQEGRARASFDSALKVLREYDPDCHILLTREAELKKNLKESHKGLAATGHGYSPIHFFAEQKFSATAEIQLLIEQEVDVNAVAFKAAMPGTDPFTPLQRAIERGHAEVVKLLLAAPEIHLGPPRVSSKLMSASFDLETLQPLLLACAKGRTEITFDLLQAGALDVLQKTNPFPARMWHGNSLLHEACWLGDADMITMLLDYQVSRRLHRWGSAADTKNSQSLSAQDAAFEANIIGFPGQTDQFGATPIMYAVDIRDCTSDSMRKFKLKARAQCLRILLEHNIHNNVNVQFYRTNIAQMLCAKWTRGPGKAHSIFCYAEETGDEELIQLVDQFRYSISVDERCSAQPRCSSERSGYVGQGLNSKEACIQDDRLDGRGVRLPSFAELMDTPARSQAPDAEYVNIWPKQTETAMGSPSSTAQEGSSGRGGSWHAPTSSGSLGSRRS